MGAFDVNAFALATVHLGPPQPVIFTAMLAVLQS
jgi:hypothetical protein